MEILRYVTDHHPVTVRDGAAYLAQTKVHVRTTALTIMERLRKKGLLTRKRLEGIFHYSPRQPKGELLRDLIRDFVDRTLGGSVSPFVAYLTQEKAITPEEIEELKRLIRGLEEQKEKP